MENYCYVRITFLLLNMLKNYNKYYYCLELLTFENAIAIAIVIISFIIACASKRHAVNIII